MKRFLPGLIAVLSLVVLTIAGTASFPWGH